MQKRSSDRAIGRSRRGELRRKIDVRVPLAGQHPDATFPVVTAATIALDAGVWFAYELPRGRLSLSNVAVSLERFS